ncbi:MAG: YicC family protein [Verrucomicrobiales bacterium]|nr:YicC family protein [Verrucomicrobiales bacterium]
MTGYGYGESAHDGGKLAVEISSVNRKQVEISVSLPRDLEVLEARVREEVLRRLSRGRVTIRVNLHAAEERRAARVKINRSLAAAYAREFAELGRELGLETRATLDTILKSPGVMESGDEVEDAESVWPALASALGLALDQLVRAREQEGAHLSADLANRLDLMRRSADAVSQRAPEVAVQYRRQLQQRIAEAGLTLTQEDQERITKEVVLFADRSDITEELTRLESHFAQFTACLSSREPVGRNLDFLAQEMNREVNTIGSKANDAAIAGHVVQLKAELERVREQAQNLE